MDSPITRLALLWLSPAASRRPLIVTYVQPASVCIPDLCYDLGIVKGGTGVYQKYGLFYHILWPGCVDAWWREGVQYL